MASNDPEPERDPVYVPESGPVAFLTRLVHIPAANDQTPLRIICVIVVGIALALTPIPFNVIGYSALIILALSLGRISNLK